ncbi:hypothetical protein STEG23_028544, partial [Scotinomys teguina]
KVKTGKLGKPVFYMSDKKKEQMKYVKGVFWTLLKEWNKEVTHKKSGDLLCQTDGRKRGKGPPVRSLIHLYIFSNISHTEPPTGHQLNRLYTGLQICFQCRSIPKTKSPDMQNHVGLFLGKDEEGNPSTREREQFEQFEMFASQLPISAGEASEHAQTFVFWATNPFQCH